MVSVARDQKFLRESPAPMSLPLQSIPWFSEHSPCTLCEGQPPVFVFVFHVPSTRVRTHVGPTMVSSVPDPESST